MVYTKREIEEMIEEERKHWERVLLKKDLHPYEEIEASSSIRALSFLEDRLNEDQ